MVSVVVITAVLIVMVITAVRPHGATGEAVDSDV